MAPLTDLLSCSIMEKDCNGDVLWTWSYPKLSKFKKKVVARQCSLDSEHDSLCVFMYSTCSSDWFYAYRSKVFDSDRLPKVKQFALILFTTDFNPEKYEVLCRMLSKTYCKTGNPVEVLELYLNVFTKGSCTSDENETFISDDFNSERFPISTNVRELIQTYKLETILIYTALLLKRKIIVYHHSLEQLLKWIRTFPALVKHYKLADHLIPCIDLALDYQNDREYYVVGCNDSSILSKLNRYYVLVNIPAREITVAPHAKEEFTMTKLHKEIALFMVQLCENQSYTEAQIISEIHDKTEDLLNQVRFLATVQTEEGYKTPSETFPIKHLSPAVNRFLLNVAVAEKMYLP